MTHYEAHVSINYSKRAVYERWLVTSGLMAGGGGNALRQRTHRIPARTDSGEVDRRAIFTRVPLHDQKHEKRDARVRQHFPIFANDDVIDVGVRTHEHHHLSCCIHSGALITHLHTS